jgi:hypothetical protein
MWSLDRLRYPADNDQGPLDLAAVDLACAASLPSLLGEAVDCYAVACSLVTDDRLLDRYLWHQLSEWREALRRAAVIILPEARDSWG